MAVAIPVFMEGELQTNQKEQLAKNAALPLMFGREFKPGATPLQTLESHKMQGYIEEMGAEVTCHQPLPRGRKRRHPLVEGEMLIKKFKVPLEALLKDDPYLLGDDERSGETKRFDIWK